MTVIRITRECEAEITAWLAERLSPIALRVTRTALQRGELTLPGDLASTFPDDWRAGEVAVEQPSRPTREITTRFGATRPRLSVYQRNDVSYLAARSWQRDEMKRDIASLKAAKATLDPDIVALAGNDLATALERLIGRDNPAVTVTHVACGHSRRPDCFACRVAQDVARRLGLKFHKVFGDRFVKGVSHPKELKKLDPIEIADKPDTPLVVVVDDVATSGWHMEEALSTLRAKGLMATGVVWLSGKVA